MADMLIADRYESYAARTIRVHAGIIYPPCPAHAMTVSLLACAGTML
jgi:hypothetical protein